MRSPSRPRLLLAVVAFAVVMLGVAYALGGANDQASAHPGDPQACPEGFIYHPDTLHCEETTCPEGLTYNFRSLYCEILDDGGPGDANCNRNIDPIDSSLILQHAAGLVDELDCEANGDVDDGGAVNAIDATLILQFSAHLIDHFR